MTTTNFLVRTSPIALASSLVGVWIVHSRLFVEESPGHLRSANESFVCDGAPCELGSGASWLFTGVALLAPIVAAAGLLWSRRLHERGRLGPFSYRAIPDSEQILEVLSFLSAGLIATWVATRGSHIEATEVGAPNSWLDGRLGDETQVQRLVPSRRSWFFIGAILAAPFAFSFGSMLGREWYARVRRTSSPAETVIDLRDGQASDDIIDLDVDVDIDIDER